jgi:hypothetical protein
VHRPCIASASIGRELQVPGACRVSLVASALVALHSWARASRCLPVSQSGICDLELGCR